MTITTDHMTSIQALLDIVADELQEPGGTEAVQFSISAALVLLAEDAIQNNRNRALDLDELKANLDPEGIHIVTRQFPHNDVEWRTMWMLKVKDQQTPVQVILDCGFEIFDKLTRSVKVRERSQGNCTHKPEELSS